jgi:hypothetical protein
MARSPVALRAMLMRKGRASSASSSVNAKAWAQGVGPIAALHDPHSGVARRHRLPQGEQSPPSMIVAPAHQVVEAASAQWVWRGPELPQAQGATREHAPPGRVEARQHDEGGTISRAAQVHRFSDRYAVASSIGITGEIMHPSRRATSTLAVQPRLVGGAKTGARIDVKTRTAHPGNTPLSHVHHMGGGRESTFLAQAVPLNPAARARRRSGKRSLGSCGKHRPVANGREP